MAATLCWIFPTSAGAEVIGRASNVVPSTIQVSPEGDHVLFVSVDPKTNKRRVYVDGRALPGVYDAIAGGTPIFSEDGQHHAFVGTRGKECMVVLDGVEQTAYPITENRWPITALLFGSGGTKTHLAYIASKGDQHYVVVNGRAHGHYHSIDSKGNEKSSLPGIWDLVLEGDYFAYRAKVGGVGKMAAFRGRITGNEIKLTKSKDYDSIGAGSPVRMGGMLDAEGGELFAFLAKDGPGKESIRQLPGDEPITKKDWLFIARNTLRASPARPGEMVYITAENGQWHTFVGEKAWPPCDTHNPLIASPSGATWACMAKTDDKLVMMVNGVPGKVYSQIQHGETMFPAGDERVVYGASTLDGSKTPARIVVDGKEGKAYTQVTGDSVIFSADRKSMAYVAGDGNKNFVVLDGAEGAKFDEIYDLRFSPVGSRLAYGARRGLEHFVVDGGKELGSYENIQQGSLVFSPDGKALAWAAFVDDGNWHVCVDGKMIDSGCDGVVSQITFPPGVSVPAYVGRYLSDGKTAFALSFGGEVGRQYNSIWMGDGGKLFVQEDGSIEYFARSGGLLYRAVAKAE
ncbi:MAG TPA: hypothetical protein QGF50_06080 [Roseibacillus sp.]|nr:hypothetical protein [Roseibacillus sp.]